MKRLRSGELSLVIGTHALLSPDVQYQNLGLVVTDEQHRFGVDQRAALVRQGRRTRTFSSCPPRPSRARSR